MKMSGAFIDMAVAVGAPIVPVRFVGGLPVARLANKIEFPVGMGKQDFVIGTPIVPEEVSALPYRDRKERSDDARRAMEASVATLRELKRDTYQAFIDNTDGYLSLFGAAWRGAPSPLRCYATYHNLLIDSYGNVFPCAMPFSNGAPPIGNVRSMPVGEFWRSETFQASRRALDGCRACYWNCHTEANLLYQRVPPA